MMPRIPEDHVVAGSVRTTEPPRDLSSPSPNPRAKRSVSRRVGVYMLIALLVAAGLGALLLTRTAPSRTTGPLYDPRYAGSGIAFSVNAGQQFSWAYTTLDNKAATPIVVESVSLIHPSPGLRLVQTQAFPAAFGPRVMVNSRRFPPKILAGASGIPQGAVPFRDVAGLTIPPTSSPVGGFILLLHLQVTGSGPFGASGVKVNYRVGTMQYTATFPDAIAVCVPIDAHCKTPAVGGAMTGARALGPSGPRPNRVATA